MTVFVGQDMGNFPAPQKLDPNIYPHGIHIVHDSVCGAGNCQFPAPQKLEPKISPHGTHTIYDSVCGAGNGQFSCPTKTRPQAPKSSQNRGIFDVYAKPKTTSVAKTPLFATPSQHNMSEMLYLTVFLDHLLKNTRIYSVL